MSISRVTKDAVKEILEITDNLAITTSSTGNIQLGEGAGGIANGTGVAIGYQSAMVSPDRNMVAVGTAALYSGASEYAVGIGYFAGMNNAERESISIGLRPNTSGAGARSIGLGSESNSSGTQAIAIGMLANGSSTDAIAVGRRAQATANEAVAVGHDTESSATKSTALGPGANSSHASSTAIGADASTTAANQVVVGTAADSVLIPGSLTISSNVGVGGDLILSNRLTTTLQNYIAISHGSTISYAVGWQGIFPSASSYTVKLPAVLAWQDFSSVTWYVGQNLYNLKGLTNVSTETFLVTVTCYLEVGSSGAAHMNIGKLNTGADESGWGSIEARSNTATVPALGANTLTCTEVLQPGESLQFATYQSTAVTKAVPNHRLRVMGWVHP